MFNVLVGAPEVGSDKPRVGHQQQDGHQVQKAAVVLGGGGVPAQDAHLGLYKKGGKGVRQGRGGGAWTTNSSKQRILLKSLLKTHTLLWFRLCCNGRRSVGLANDGREHRCKEQPRQHTQTHSPVHCHVPSAHLTREQAHLFVHGTARGVARGLELLLSLLRLRRGLLGLSRPVLVPRRVAGTLVRAGPVHAQLLRQP